MTTLELLKAAMQDNKKIELMKTDAESKKKIRIYNFIDEAQIEIYTMFDCTFYTMVDDKYEYNSNFLESTRHGKTEEELFQTVADLYDGTIENFLEKVE